MPISVCNIYKKHNVTSVYIKFNINNVTALHFALHFHNRIYLIIIIIIIIIIILDGAKT